MIKKLNSNSGATFLWALLYMLVALMVCVTILDDSVTAAKQMNDDAEWEQDHLTIASAGELFGDALSKTKCVIKTTTASNGTITDISIESEGPLKEVSEKIVDDLVRRGDGEGEITLNSGDNHKVVNVQYEILPETIDEDISRSYRIDAVLTMENSEHKLYLTAYNSAGIAVQTEKQGDQTITTKTIRWSSVHYSTKKED